MFWVYGLQGWVPDGLIASRQQVVLMSSACWRWQGLQRLKGASSHQSNIIFIICYTHQNQFIAKHKSIESNYDSTQISKIYNSTAK